MCALGIKRKRGNLDRNMNERESQFNTIKKDIFEFGAVKKPSFSSNLNAMKILGQ